MKRDLLQKLIAWKKSSTRKPLVLNGARQVGKTTLLKAFAKKHYSNSVYLNFEDKPALKRLFMEDLEPNRIIQAIALYFKQAILPGETLLIFDEVQESPEALNSLKYFCENASEYHVCAAGSLLGVKLAHTKGFPVGKVNFAQLYPLSFFEFLDAIDQAQLREYLEQIELIQPLTGLIHEKLMKLLKLYLLIGGMPEAVATYVKNEDFYDVRDIQQEILAAYVLDFAKHAPSSEVIKITEVWQSLPNQLAKENKKFIYSVIKDSARGRHYDNAIQWLVEAGLVYKIYNISAPKLPIKAYAKHDSFKLYLVDVGLLCSMASISPKVLLDDEQLFSEFRGSFIENYVAQVLMQYVDQLHYWTSEGKAEIDFVIQHEQYIIPIEVKSGMSRKKKSLQVYQEKYQPKLSVIVSPLNLKHDGTTLNCPLYLADRLITKLIDSAID